MYGGVTGKAREGQPMSIISQPTTVGHILESGVQNISPLEARLADDLLDLRVEEPVYIARL